MSQILVVDDEIGIRELLSEILSDEGHSVHLAENATAAREFRARARPDLVLLDIWMPDSDGVTLLKEWASMGQLTMPVVMMSGHATIDTAVEATRIGALDFLEKPIALQRLLTTVKRALTREENRVGGSGLLADIGRSPALADLKRRLAQLAAADAPLFIRGERGMLPELFARLAHRPGTPWVNAAQALAEGSPDLLQQAAGGVLFVEDLAALGAQHQKQLAFLAGRAARARARLVCFSSESPRRLTADFGFDPLLVSGLSELRIALPTLEELREDLPAFAQAALAQMVEMRAAPARRFSAAALQLLAESPWPGNLEEVLAAVRTLASTAAGEEIGVEDARAVLAQFAAPPETAAEPRFEPLFDQPLREARDAFERAYFEHQLAAAGGSIARVAEKSGLERTHLYRKLKALGVAMAKKDTED
jgi:DNA-binding NtrC family response regulator